MWQTIRKEDALAKLRTKEEGLNNTEVKRRKEKYGTNVIHEKQKESLAIRFIKQFNDFMIIILIIAAIVSAGISLVQGVNDYIDSIIIIAIVILNAIMGLVQETKAEKSIEALKKLTPQTVKVMRAGIQEQINAEELVPGDIIILENGNYIPADCRLIETHNLLVDESSLTGETEGVLKDENHICNKDVALGDMVNLVFMGTMVIGGNAKAVVTEIGMKTKMGQIAGMIMQNEAPQTPIQKKLEQVGKILGVTCLVICAIIFVMGIIKDVEPIEMFMTSVGLAVAAIPEGLPAIVTIMLSIGVTKMAKKHSIIRKLPAVETLGSSNVICSDKTGTLTQNKMEVVEVKSSNQELAIELSAMCNNCEIIEEDAYNTSATTITQSTPATTIAQRTPAEIVQNTPTKIVQGEPTEKALVEYALKNGKNKNQLYKQMERIEEIPFDSKRKMMTTIHRKGANYRIITKGAPDILLDHCTKIYQDGKIETMDYKIKDKIKNQNIEMANKALRVIAVAYLDIDKIPTKIDSKNIENNLIYVGLIGMIDPPREGVKEAVAECRRAGIKTVMITGDHIATATAIAKELGILTLYDKAITGAELDRMSQKQLQKEIKQYSVFARVTPEHKVRIVKAWQYTGAVVAMTGDGVNDSPALKNADIGISMGKNGTDVAKNASDMILTDDNFVTITEAVKQGRNIYDNIKKAVHFLISTNIGEIVVIFMGLVLGFKSPLLAIQLLWINLISDSFPAIALGLEKPDEDIMKRKPVNARKGIFADGMFSKIITEGIMIGFLALVTFSIGNKYYGLTVGRTMAFVSIGMLELIHSFNIKSEKSIFETGITDNKYLLGSFALGMLMQIIVVIVPALANIFQVTSLNAAQWLTTIAISILPIPIMELQKKINREAEPKYFKEYKTQ